MGLRQRMKHDKKLQVDFMKMILVQQEIDLAVNRLSLGALLSYTHDGDLYVPRGLNLYVPTCNLTVTGKLRLKGKIVAWIPWDERKYPR